MNAILDVLIIPLQSGKNYFIAAIICFLIQIAILTTVVLIDYFRNGPLSLTDLPEAILPSLALFAMIAGAWPLTVTFVILAFAYFGTYRLLRYFILDPRLDKQINKQIQQLRQQMKESVE